MAFRNFLFTAYETIFTLVFKRDKKKATILLFLQPFSNLKHLEVFVLSLFLSFFLFFFCFSFKCLMEALGLPQRGPLDHLRLQFVVSNHKSNKKSIRSTK